MTDCNISSIGLLAEALCRPGGSESSLLQGMSLQRSGPISSFISALLSSDEGQMQKRLAELADRVSSFGSSSAWFDLGRVAAALYFRSAAEDYFEKSADLAHEHGECLTESSAWLAIGNLYSDDEDWDMACQFYEKALSPNLSEGASLRCDVLSGLGRASRLRGDLSHARQCYSQALSLLDEADLVGRSHAKFCLGEISAQLGDLAEAERCYEKSLSLREKCRDREGMASSLAALASVYRLMGQPGRVQSSLEKARHHLDEAGLKAGAARMHLSLADFFFEEGRMPEAVDRYEKGLAALGDCDLALAARSTGRLGQCFVDLGDISQAAVHISRAADLSRGQGDLDGEADLMALLAGIYRDQGRLDDAMKCSVRCLELGEQQNNSDAVAFACSHVGQIHIDMGQYGPGALHFQRAADLFMEQSKLLQAGQALCGLAGSYHLQGNIEEAQNCYNRALEIFNDIGNEQGCAQVRANLGIICQSLGDLSSAEDHLQKSLESRDGVDLAGYAGVKLSLGLTAQLRGDWDGAQEHFEQAAKAYEDLGDKAGFSLAQNNLGNLHSDRGDARKAILCYNLSIDAKRSCGDRQGMATTLANLAACYHQERDHERAEKIYQESLQIFRDAGDGKGEGRALLGLAGLKADMGSLKESLRHFRESLSIEIEQEDSSGITAALYGLANVSIRSGLWQEAEESYACALEKLGSSGDSPTVAAVLCSWGDLKADLGEWDEAASRYQESLAMLERLGDFYSTAVARNNLANICHRRGDWTEALKNYSGSLDEFSKAGDDRSRASVLSNIASLSLKRGDVSRALECYQESLALFEGLEDLAGAARVLENLGELYRRRGERSLSREQYTRALEIHRRLGDGQGAAQTQANMDLLDMGGVESPANIDDCLRQIARLEEEGDLSGQAEVHSLVAGYHADAGRWDDALSCYKESLRLFSDVGETHNRAQILFNMALVYKDRGDLAEACELLTQAMEIFERLGAVPCIAQADLTLGVILGLQGRFHEADCRFDKAIKSQEALEALPELCEAYLSRAQLMASVGRLVEAEFYLGRAQTLISRADCQILNILLFQVQGDLNLKKGRTGQAEECFEMALAASRSLASPYEEAKALASLGRLALQIKDYPEAEARLEQALGILRPLGAALDIWAIYGDLQRLFMARGDCIRAEEMAALEKDCACRQGCLEKKAPEPMAELAARSPLLIGKLG